MDSLKLIIFLISISSIVLAGTLSVYWFQFTDEGKKFWRTKIKRINMEELQEEEKAVTFSDLRGLIKVIKSSSTLLKLWLFFYALFFLSLVAMVLFAALTK
ncbi:hypothetical protein [Gracilibacillus sp. YIM 98692]|uniref:hypothetical protein n=1 Tax=Gracilibacillus sp. YIM 98692 TaxID=2663532 RepID=UPI0013D6FFF6|nr:hypothetical protein [Gracilibacillus sp. YIM 98692]